MNGEKINQNEATFFSYFGKLNRMPCATQLGITYIDSLIESFGFEMLDPDDVKAKVSIPQEVRNRFLWLPEWIEVEGTITEQTQFILKGKLENIPDFPELLFSSKEIRLVFVNREYFSDMYLEWDVTLGTKQKLPYCVCIYPFQNNESVHLYAQLQEEVADNSQTDPVSVLKDCFGIEMNFAEQVPSFFAFPENVKMTNFQISAEGNWLEKEDTETIITNYGVQLSYVNETEALLKIGEIELKRPFLNLSYGKNGTDKFFSIALGGILSIAGIEVEFVSSFPFRYLTVENNHGKTYAIADVAQKCGLNLPDFLKDVVIDRLSIEMAFVENSYEAYLRFSEQTQKQLCPLCREEDGVNIGMEYSSLYFAYNNQKAEVVLDSQFVICDGEKDRCTFLVKGSFSSEAVIISGNLIYNTITLNRIYELLFGNKLPSVFPAVTIESLSLKALCGSEFEIQSISGRVCLEMQDTSVFGCEFTTVLEARADNTQIIGTGTFLFGGYFTVEVKLLCEKGETGGLSWEFGLILKDWKVVVTYDDKKRQIKGELIHRISIADIADVLLQIKNPSASFERTGTWSFLEEIAFERIAVTYFYDAESLELTGVVNYKNEFLELEKVMVCFGATGVTFRMVGRILGEEYTEDSPYAFGAEEPPQISGKGFEMKYFVLANGVKLNPLNEFSVQKSMEQLKQQWNKDTKLAELTADSSFGIVTALDFEAAGMLRVQLIYKENNSYCAGRFELFSQKAGALNGLCGELSYQKVTGQIGMFSGTIVPPNSLKNIRVGAVTCSIGTVAARIYTNGDFYLDLGFPEKFDFKRSFAFSYGVFNGSGGIYLQRSTGALANTLPDTRGKGYYTAVCALGIGICLSLGTSYNGGLLKAQANITLKGILEGVYATYIDNSGKSQGYYAVSAAVSLDGCLKGSVDFGIIGAAVSVILHANANIELKSDVPTQVNLGFEVSASATVKIVFVRINFKFHLKGNLNFTLGSNKKRVWRSVAARRGALLLPDLTEEVMHIHLYMTPTFSAVEGRIAAVILLLMKNEDYKQMIALLSKVMGENDYLENTGGMELFDSGVFFRNVEEIYTFLQRYVVFHISALTEQTDIGEDAVFMPVPEFCNITLETLSVTGQLDCAKRKLSSYCRIDDGYLNRMTEYFEKTRPDVLLKVDADDYSMSARIFADFFELAVKAIRTQVHERRMKEECVNAAFKNEEFENIQGITNRFILGGRRSLENDRGIMRGIFELAGQQMELSDRSSIASYTFSIQPDETVPDWLVFEQEKVSVTYTKEEVKSFAPDFEFESDIFISPPQVQVFYEETEPADITPSVLFTSQKAAYYSIPLGMMAGDKYLMKEDTCPIYGGLFWLSLKRAENTDMYTIEEYGDTKWLDEWIAMDDSIESIALLYHEDGADKELDTDCFILRNGPLGISEKTLCMAHISEKVKWLQMILLSIKTKGSYYIGFDSGKNPWTEETVKVSCFVRFAQNTETERYRNAFTGIYVPEKTEFLLHGTKKEKKEVIAAGHLAVTAKTSAENLSESQKKLYELYNNMAAELVFEDRTSNETVSYISNRMEDKDTYTLLIPYAKAYDAEDVYELIHKGQEIRIRTFLVDMFGNRMKKHKEILWHPVYTDKLISFEEYEGMTCYCTYAPTDSEEEIEVQIHLEYRPREESEYKEEEPLNLSRGICQLRQPDVKVLFHTSCSDSSVELDKEELEEFFESCEEQEDSEGENLVLDFQMKLAWKQCGLYRMTQQITIERDSGLCLEDAPKEVQSVTCQVMMDVKKTKAQSKKSVQWENLHFYQSGEENYALYLPQKELVKKKETFITYGFVPFARVTGNFGDKNGNEYVMNSIDMNIVLDNYLEDINKIFSPSSLYALYKDAACRNYIPDLFILREKTAEGLASRICPLEQTEVSEKELSLIRSYAKSLFFSKNYLDRKRLVFLQSRLELFAPKNLWLRVNGTIGEGEGMSGGFEIREDEDAFLQGCIDAPDWIDLKQAAFRMRNMESMEEGNYFVPKEEREGTELLTCQMNPYRVRVPAQYAPQAPIPLSFEKTKEEIIIKLKMRGVNRDRIYFSFDENRKVRAVFKTQFDWVAAMENYRTQASELLQNLTEDNLKKVIALMEDFCEALKMAPMEADMATGTFCLQFEADEEGKLARMVPIKGIREQDWKIRYASPEYPVTELKWDGNAYCFPKSNMPLEESDMLLEFVCPRKLNEALEGGRAFMTRMRLVNDTDSMLEPKHVNPVFRMVSNKVEF